MTAFKCSVCKCDLGWDRPSGVCSTDCLNRLQGFAPTIQTGTNNMGLRWATTDGYRLVAYAQGGYCCQRRVPGVGRCLFPDGESMLENVERALCNALAIEYVS